MSLSIDFFREQVWIAYAGVMQGSPPIYVRIDDMPGVDRWLFAWFGRPLYRIRVKPKVQLLPGIRQ